MSGILYPLNYEPSNYKFMKLENLQKIKIYHTVRTVHFYLLVHTPESS